MSTKTTRLLAAVMFTDIVGYTATMQEDENKANRQRDRHRKVLEKRAKEFEGRPLHFYGDGAITIFSSAYNAVMCAIQIQKDLKYHALPLRIGIHMGDIVYNEAEVYGDAVNIASRLEDLSVPGGVLISEKIVDEIKNHRDIKTISLGSYELKNVKQPVRIFAVSNKGLKVPVAGEINAQKGELSGRIAVLPFVNMTNEIGFDFFSDGLTEEIINGLAKMKGLEVTSRTSAFAYKGINEDVRQIGEKLSVSQVLEGSVRKQKDKIRVTAQLIETQGGFHLWSETFDGHLKDLFEIQDTISHEIVTRFKQGYEPASQIDVKKFDSEDLKAYELFLEGKFQWNKWTIPSIQKAMQSFKKAIDNDPELAGPYPMIANCYLYLGVMGQMSSRLALKKAEAYINKGLALDDSSAAAWVARANLYTFLEFDFEKADAAFKRALALNGRNMSADPCFYYSIYLNIIGENKQAFHWIEEALKVEPQNVMYNTMLGRFYFSNQQYHEALYQYNIALEFDSSFLPAIDGKGWVYAAMGEHEAAHQLFEIYQNLVSQDQKNIPQLIYMAAKLGREDVAEHFLDLLQIGEPSDNYTATSLDIALICLGLKKYDEVFFHLERSFDDRIGSIVFIDTNPVWDEIKSDSRYKKLMARIGLNDGEKLLPVISAKSEKSDKNRSLFL